MNSNVIFRTTASLIVAVASTMIIDCPSSIAQSSMSPEALDYLDRALNSIQNQALNTNSIDWNEFKRKVYAVTPYAKTPADTYPAIGFALKQLNDHHSHFKMANGKVYDSGVRGPMIAPLSVMPNHTNRLIKYGNKSIGLLVVPTFGGSAQTAAAQQFAKMIADAMRSFYSSSPTGWIIDLQTNEGGNMWPMLAAVGPLLGNTNIGAFKGANTTTVPSADSREKSRVMWIEVGVCTYK